MPLKVLHPKNMSLKSERALFINSDREEIVPRLVGEVIDQQDSHWV